jgi:hypothetical protein
MNAKARNMLEAAIPPPPPLSTLLTVLLEQVHADQVEDDPHFGKLYEGADNLQRNSARMQACVTGVLRDFTAVCRKKGTVYENVDRFFNGMAKFYIEGSLQFDDPVKQLLFEETREKFSRCTLHYIVCVPVVG